MTEVLERKANWANGEEIVAFEHRLSEIVDVNYCTVFNSGTSALNAALVALGIGPGDKVIVPAFTFISVANSVRMVGGVPVFVDIERQTFGLDPKLVEETIKKDDYIKAVIAPHFAGIPCNIDMINKICKRNNILLIEDAAEALGASKGQKMCGSFGNMSILSFAANKIISTGEGGACLTNSYNNQVNILEKIRSHGRTGDANYFRGQADSVDYIKMGYNWRMPSMCAALGLAQLSRLGSICSQREAIAKKYDEGLKDCTLIKRDEYGRSVVQFYSVLVDKRYRYMLKRELMKKGIDSQIYFRPINKYSFYKQYRDIDLPRTYEISDSIISLPCYPGMSENDQEIVINVFNSALASF